MNDNSLVTNVLQSIDEIEKSTFISEMSVGNALIDLYIKEAEITKIASLTNKEVVQESWFDYDPNESIFKFILLYIPRMIIKIFKRLRLAFDYDYKQAEKAEEDYKRQLANAAEDAKLEEAERIRSLYTSIPNVTTGRDEGIFYKSLIKDFEELRTYLDVMTKACHQYSVRVKDIDIQKVAAGEEDIPDELFDVFHTAIGRHWGSIIAKSDSERKAYRLPAYRKEMKATKKLIDDAANESAISMNLVQKTYSKMTAQGISLNNTSYTMKAERMYKDFREMRENLQDVVVACNTEEAEHKKAYEAIIKAVKEQERLEKEAKRKALLDDDDENSDKKEG